MKTLWFNASEETSCYTEKRFKPILLQQPLGYHTNDEKARDLSKAAAHHSVSGTSLETEKTDHCPHIKLYRRYIERLQHDCFGGELLQPRTEPGTHRMMRQKECA